MLRKTIWLVIRLALFVSILTLGTVLAMSVGEQEGLARVNLTGIPVHTITSGSPDGRVLYAGTGGQGTTSSSVYKSVDGGQSWQPLSMGLELSINALAVHPANPEVIYVGSQGGSSLLEQYSLYRSTDGGHSWQKAPLSLPAGADGRLPSVLCLAIAPQDPGVLYVGTDSQGAYKIADEGYTLLGLGRELQGARVEHMVVDPDHSQRVYAVTDRGLYRSENGGKNWTALKTPEQAVALAVARKDNQVLYVGTASMGVYRSADGGATWQPIGADLGLRPGVALSVTALAVDPRNENVVYAAPVYRLGTTQTHLAPLGIYVSRNGGTSWTLINKASGSMVTHLLADPASSDVVYASTQQGVVRYGRRGGGGSALSLPTRPQPPLRWAIVLLTLLAAATSLVFRPSWLRPLGMSSKQISSK